MSRHILIANCMTRNEPTVPFAILSIINYIDKIIVIDTGSTDETYQELRVVQKMYPQKIILEQRFLEDGQNWSVSGGQVHTTGISESTSIALGDIRREMLERSNSEWVITLDSDEIYEESLIRCVRNYINKDCYGNIAMFLPFMDLIRNIKQIRHLHWMGRVYRKNMVDIRGNFPYEQHHNKLTGECLEYWSNDVKKVEFSEGLIFHFESLVKVGRKEDRVIEQNNRPLPSIIDKYKEQFPRIKKYIGE